VTDQIPIVLGGNRNRRPRLVPGTLVDPGPQTDWPPVRTTVPTKNTVVTQPNLISLNSSALGLLRRVTFGPAGNLGARWIYARGGSTVYLVAALGRGPLKSITPKADGVALVPPVTGNHWHSVNGLIDVWTYDGSQVSLDAASGLVQADPSWDEVHTGEALAYIKIRYDATKQTTFPDFTFDVEGYRDCLDTRTGLRGYTENPILIAREMATNTTWGMRLDAAGHFDDIVASASAVLCDEKIFPSAPAAPPTLVDLGTGVIAGQRTQQYVYTRVNVNDAETLPSPAGGIALGGGGHRVQVTCPVDPSGLTVKYNIYRRYTVNPFGFVGAAGADGIFTDNVADAVALAGARPPTVAPRPERYRIGITCDRQASAEDWIDTILSHCLGTRTTDDGKLQLRILTKLPAGYVPKEFDVATNVDPKSVTVSRKERSLLANQVTCNVTDAAHGWSYPTPVTRERPTVTAGTERPRPKVLELPGLLDKNTGGRVSTTEVNLDYNDLLVTFRTTREGMAVQPLDVIKFTGAGLAGQYLRVVTTRKQGEDRELFCIEYQDANFDDVVNAEDAPVEMSLPDPDESPPDPMPTLTEDVLTGPTGPYTSRIRVDWTLGDTPFYKFTRVVVNDGVANYVLSETSFGPVYIENPRRFVLHTITLQTVTVYNKESPGAVAFITPVFAPPPPDVINLRAPSDTEEERGSVYWDAPAYEFVDHYQVFDVSADWSNAADPDLSRMIATWPKDFPPTKDNPLRIARAVHGDGFTTDLVFSVQVRVVAMGNPGLRSGGATVSWRLPATGRALFAVGGDPREVTFDGASVWVANWLSGTVEQVDRATGAVLQTITVGTKPDGLAFSPETSAHGDLWVANFGSDSVTRIGFDAAGVGTIVATVLTGGSSGPLKLEWDGALLWVSCFTAGTVKRIDPLTNQVTQTTTVGAKPCGLHYRQRRLFVANYGSNTVSVLQVADDFPAAP
jgi:YVTN family beta-propeller protein